MAKLLAEAFPEIEELMVNVRERDTAGKAYETRAIDKNQLEESISCSNPNCHLGGFVIDLFFRRMVRERKTEEEVMDICRGYDGVWDRQGSRTLCGHTFQAKISIKYKTQDSLVSIPIDIKSVGANHALLHALIQNRPDAQGSTSFTIGDMKQITDGVHIRYDYQLAYESEAAVEPIYFTILMSIGTGVASGLITNYIWENIGPYLPKIKDISIRGKPVTPTKEDIAKAFLDEVEKLEDMGDTKEKD